MSKETHSHVFNKKKLLDRLHYLKSLTPEQLEKERIKFNEPWINVFNRALDIIGFIEFKEEFKTKEELSYIELYNRLGARFTHAPASDYQILERYLTDKQLAERSHKITLLEEYSKFLEAHGYLDTDWRAEPPFAIDEFMKELAARNQGASENSTPV